MASVASAIVAYAAACAAYWYRLRRRRARAQRFVSHRATAILPSRSDPQRTCDTAPPLHTHHGRRGQRQVSTTTRSKLRSRPTSKSTSAIGDRARSSTESASLARNERRSAQRVLARAMHVGVDGRAVARRRLRSEREAGAPRRGGKDRLVGEAARRRDHHVRLDRALLPAAVPTTSPAQGCCRYQHIAHTPATRATSFLARPCNDHRNPRIQTEANDAMSLNTKNAPLNHIRRMVETAVGASCNSWRVARGCVVGHEAVWFDGLGCDSGRYIVALRIPHASARRQGAQSRRCHGREQRPRCLGQRGGCQARPYRLTRLGACAYMLRSQATSMGMYGWSLDHVMIAQDWMYGMGVASGGTTMLFAFVVVPTLVVASLRMWRW